MSHENRGYTLRPATEADMDRMRQIAQEGLRPYVTHVWGWDQADQDRRFCERFDPTSSSLIEVDGHDVGYLQLYHQSDHTYISGVYLQPESRNQGLGRRIIEDIQTEAARRGRSVALQVLNPNPARRLYERLGFRAIEETDTHVRMEWSVS